MNYLIMSNTRGLYIVIIKSKTNQTILKHQYVKYIDALRAVQQLQLALSNRDRLLAA